jgi:flagellar hook-associated protein 1 FlgK
MSYFGVGLGAGLKALNAARMAIHIAGQNVANANTEGYSRQRVLLGSAFPFDAGRRQLIGTGVEIDEIGRIVDDGLERRLRLQLGMSGSAEADALRWQEIEGFFGEPDNGLSTHLSDLFTRVGRLQSDPADRALRGGVVQAGKTVAQNFNLLAERFGQLAEATLTEARGLVQQINEAAKAVAELNANIVGLEAGGAKANDLRDTRERHVKTLSKLIDVRTIERSNGTVDVIAGGSLLVAGDRTLSVSAGKDASGHVQLLPAGSKTPLTVASGRLAALLAHEREGGAAVLERLDGLAYQMALEWNRVHTTGVPRGGPFQQLLAAYGAADGDGDNVRGDELLAQSGWKYAVQDGALWVTVTNRATGDLERTRVAIDPQADTLQAVAARLDAIEHLDASVDPAGRLRIAAEQGYGFDFGNRLDSRPDAFGSFGGAHPSFSGTGAGPFNVTVPATFTITANGTPTTVTLNAADFADPSRATLDELAAAINADAGAAVTAKNVGGRLTIRSDSAGASATLLLTDGAGGPLAALGFTAGNTQTGQDLGVDVEIAGKYTGSANGRLFFRPDGDGSIGVTQGLKVGVFDESGARVATLDVGRGSYSPGDWLEVADGVKVKFGPGNVSATANHTFALDTLADSDTSDFLVAAGLNSFFLGSTAADLAINPELEHDADLLAAGLSGAPGDSANLGRLLQLRTSKLEALGDATIEDHYGALVGDLGFEVASAEATLAAQTQLLEHLQAQREQVSGVNVDEEMVDLVAHQQAFEAASRFINVVSELTQTVINLGSR